MTFDKNTKPLVVSTILTPLGEMRVGSTELGICLLEFLNLQKQEQGKGISIQKMNGIPEGDNEHIKQVKLELNEYFAGQRTQFDVPVHPMGTTFQLAVWKYLQSLPFGTTTTYMKQAFALGNPRAQRAVATANAQNKIAIVIPCHRVIGTNGKLTGYAGGLERKRWLLDFEYAKAGKRDNLLF